MEDWKELEIGNIPSDFFVNENYEVQSRWKGVEWLNTSYSSVDERFHIIGDMQEDDRLEYRYRLKPLKPIRITKEIAKMIGFTLNCKPNTFNGRVVEIIR